MGKQVDFVNKIFIRNVVKQAKLNLKKQGRNVTGKLKNSLRGQVVGEDVLFYFEDYGRQIDTGRLGRVSSPAPQGMFQMVSAGRPPTAPIRRWIKRTSQQPSNGITIQSLAYVEARAIGRKGVRGGGFFTRAFNKYYPAYTDDLAEAYADDIIEVIDKI
jgi:hypothetical protein